MSIQNQNLDAIFQWHQECPQGEAPPPQNKALLRVVNGRLELAHQSDMSRWDRFLCFFGFGKYALEKVSRVVRETVEQAQDQNLTSVVDHLNQKITTFSNRHTFRRIACIASRTIGQPATPATTEEGAAQTSATPSTEADELAKVLAASKQAFEEQQNLPRVEMSDDLQILAERQTTTISEGYGILAPYFSGALIKGDGHCLFRSIATALLQKDIAWLEGKINIAVLKERLLKSSQELGEKSYDAVLNSILARLENSSVQEIINDEYLSDNFVQFLRFLSVAPSRVVASAPKENKDQFIALLYSLDAGTIAREDLDSKETSQWDEKINWWRICAYLHDQENIARPMWGGHIEQSGICETLGISMAILDVANIGRSGQIQSNVTVVPIGHQGPPDIYLFFEGSHYNAAFPRDLQQMQGIFGPST